MLNLNTTPSRPAIGSTFVNEPFLSTNAWEATMTNARRHPRITDVHALRARLGSDRDARGVDRVLNLSEGGMLVADDTLTVGQSIGFELSGPSFHYAGVAEVMHLTNETTGLRFLSWQTRDNRPIRSLIEQRSGWKAPANAGDRPGDPVIRRVAVLTGPARRSPPRTPSPSPPPESGRTPHP
jgi:hypothetical protein